MISMSRMTGFTMKSLFCLLFNFFSLSVFSEKLSSQEETFLIAAEDGTWIFVKKRRFKYDHGEENCQEILIHDQNLYN